MSRRLTSLALAGISALAISSAAMAGGSGGVTGPAFYVDGEVYRTVGTPTDFSQTGAPEHSYDTIYAFSGGEQMNVATAAPGDRDYNGGRWRVVVLEFTDYSAAVAAHDSNGSGDFDNDSEVDAAIEAGAASTAYGPSFECPVIKMPKGKNFS